MERVRGFTRPKGRPPAVEAAMVLVEAINLNPSIDLSLWPSALFGVIAKLFKERGGSPEEFEDKILRVLKQYVDSWERV